MLKFFLNGLMNLFVTKKIHKNIEMSFKQQNVAYFEIENHGLYLLGAPVEIQL